MWKIWPTYPATFVDHDLTPGATVHYFMTGPEGDKHHGWWKILSVDAPHGLELEDGFDEETGEKDDLPSMAMRVTLREASGGTSMEIRTSFPTDEAMAQMITMGIAEGMTAALGQVDGLLAG